MCHDERFLNLWIKDRPFYLRLLQFTFYRLDYICPDTFPRATSKLPSTIRVGMTISACALSVSAILVSVGGLVFHLCKPPLCLESLRILVSAEITSSFLSQCSFTAFQLAEMAAFIACFTSISLGYSFGLCKSFLFPVVVPATSCSVSSGSQYSINLSQVLSCLGQSKILAFFCSLPGPAA